MTWLTADVWNDTAIWSWTFALYLAGFVAAIDAIWNGRTSQGTLAWVTTLTFIPFLALPLYLFFGSRRFHGYKKARKAGKDALDLLTEQQSSCSQAYPSRYKSTFASPLEKLARIPQTEKNHAQLLINGEMTFAHIFRGIEAAQSSILIQFYIINNDQLGQRLQQALIKKAKQGIEIYFLFDEIGSSLDDDYLDALSAAGIHCSRFNPLKFKFGQKLQLNFRNHRKLIIIDGETCFLGGHNVGDEYLSSDPKLGPWRDTHLQIDGPATLAAQLSFVEDWYWAQQEMPKLNWKAFVNQGSQYNDNILMIPGGPADNVETTSLSFVHLIQQAKQRLWIATPYFIPDLKVMGALQLAALKGIDIHILLPDKSENAFIQYAMISYVKELSELGIQFHRYQAGFMHQKVMLIDQDACFLGSANLDNRSLRINFELNALIESQSLSKQVEQMLLTDFSNSKDFKIPSTFTLLLAKAARLLSPIL